MTQRVTVDTLICPSGELLPALLYWSPPADHASSGVPPLLDEDVFVDQRRVPSREAADEFAVVWFAPLYPLLVRVRDSLSIRSSSRIVADDNDAIPEGSGGDIGREHLVVAHVHDAVSNPLKFGIDAGTNMEPFVVTPFFEIRQDATDDTPQ